MTELLAIPARDTPKTPLTAWVEQLAGQGWEVAVERESTAVSWVEVKALRLRGYAMTAGRVVEAINFEIGPPEGPAQEALEHAAAALAWELHPDDEDDAADDDD